MTTTTRTLTTPLDADLYDQANGARVRRRWSWRQMIEAALAPLMSVGPTEPSAPRHVVPPSDGTGTNSAAPRED